MVNGGFLKKDNIRIRKDREMVIKPEIAFYQGMTPIYKCQCNYRFRRIELMSNDKIKGTRNYCPNCKTKFVFDEK